MLRITFANLRAHKTRLLLSSLAIVLGVAFVSGTFVFTGSIKEAVYDTFAKDVGKADVVVSAQGNAKVPQDVLTTVRGVEGVAHVAARIIGRTPIQDSHGELIRESYGTAIVSLANNPKLRWQELAKGRWPAGPGEAVLDQGSAQSLGVTIGETLRVPRDAAKPRGASRALSVVGLVDLGNSPKFAGAPFLGVTHGQSTALTDTGGYTKVLALGAQDVSASTLAENVDQAVGSSYTVRTGEQQAQYQAGQATGSMIALTTVLLGFAGIAMFVAAIVIANTFTILLAQRLKELALLRCVAATRGQVFRSVLAESAALGLAGSIVGTLAGYGLAYGGGTAAGAIVDRFNFTVVPPSLAAILVPLAVGVVVTVAAAVFPARSATRIPPVAALRDQGVPSRRAGAVRVTLATLTLVTGSGGLAAGLAVLSGSAGFMVSFAGGGLAFLGILLAGPVFIPPAIRVLGALPARLMGVPGRLAAVNAVRNPRRASATTSALLVGVTLISLMTVGASSVRETTTTELDKRYPIDYVISSATGSVPSGVVGKVRSLQDLSQTAVVHAARGRVDGTQTRIAGLRPQRFQQVTRSSSTSPLNQLQPGEVVLGKELAHRLDAKKGETVRLSGEDASAKFRVSAVTDQVKVSAGAVTTQRDLRQIATDLAVPTVFAVLRDGAPGTEVTEAINQATAQASGVTVSGAIAMKQVYTRTLDTILLVVTAMLGVAVLIAFVGIANTLALSVIERSRESALLRAAGLTRGQLRGMLSGEAVLIAAVGGLLGVGLGAVFGWAAVSAILPESFDVILAVPEWRMAAFVLGAAIAGLLASLLPARRAARTSVVAALAEE